MKILLVEDMSSLAHVYTDFLGKAGYDVTHVTTGADALDKTARIDFDGFVIDLGLPDMDGSALITALRSAGAKQIIIVVTADASISRAVSAVRCGAHDYLVKPIQQSRLVETLGQAIAAAKNSFPNQQINSRELIDEPGASSFLAKTEFVGKSEPMQNVYQVVSQVARSRASIFITGESGTGKEVCAEAIHHLSSRASKPFIALNCAAIPKDLVESEIFGHLRGAFTGAIADRDGAAFQANGGTLFLDEICELDLALQTKLLRFLQTGIVQKIGASKSEPVDVRIICATNKDPNQEVNEGRFRDDLFYRLHVIPVHMPRLCDRGDDILTLAMHFLDQYSAEESRSFDGFDSAARTALAGYEWPGNVRELQNVMRQIVVLNTGSKVSFDMLPPELTQKSASSADDTGLPCDASPNHRNSDLHHAAVHSEFGKFFGQELWRIEQAAINTTISACGGSIPKAAKILGVSPSTIYRKRENWLGSELRTA